MTAQEVLTLAEREGVLLSRNGEALRYLTSRGPLSQELRSLLADHKSAVRDLLRYRERWPLTVCVECGTLQHCGTVRHVSGECFMMCRPCQKMEKIYPEIDHCQMFCDRPVSSIRRADPGGEVCCPDCLQRLRAIRPTFTSSETCIRCGEKPAAVFSWCAECYAAIWPEENPPIGGTSQPEQVTVEPYYTLCNRCQLRPVVDSPEGKRWCAECVEEDRQTRIRLGHKRIDYEIPPLVLTIYTDEKGEQWF